MMDPMQRQAELSMMIDAQRQAQMQGQQPQGVPQMPSTPQETGSGSPLLRGSLDAMRTIRQSMDMDPNQNRRALGRAIQMFGRGMGNPQHYMGHGFGATLGAMNQSLGPAMDAYGEQEAQEQSLNAQALQQAMKIQQYEQDRKDAEARALENQRFRDAQLAETRRYHDLQNAILGTEDFDEKKSKGLIPKEALYVPEMPANKQNAIFKQQMKEIEAGTESAKVLGILDEIKELNAKHPDMYKDFNNIFYQKADDPNKDLSGWIKDVAINKKTKTALDEMNKLTSRLVLGEAKTATGQRSSDAFRQLIARGKPSFGITADANEFIVNGMRKEYTPTYEHAIAQRQAMLHNGFVPFNIQKYSEPKKDKPEGYTEDPAIQMQSNLDPASFVQKVRSEKPEESKDMTDEEIVSWGKQRGKL